MYDDLSFLKSQQCYYMHLKATIIREFRPFHLVEIQVSTFDNPIIVDISSLTIEPDFSNTVSLYILGGKNH